MFTRIKGIVAATVLATAAVFAGSTSGAVAAGPSLQAFGLIGDGTVMCAFKTDNPQQLDWVRAVTGLVGDTRLVGLDIRVQDGLLYGVGNQGGVYTVVAPPQPPTVVITKVSQLTIPLYGTNFGVDFNPAADRLRVISDSAQNLRHNLNNHTTVEDLPLNRDGAPARGITGAGYTNNDLDPATATTLYDIDTVNDQLVIQSPPNNGSLVPVGNLGVDAGPVAGFDIFSDLTNGKTNTVTAFATLMTPNGVASLYTINLFTGAATPVGAFPLAVNEVAVALDTM